ncbi:MAG TPA: succinylglutamate desuccinylase/aspartoacylase family protein [Polyangiaceae bacterium]|nr:succinylglutamate desuccinylase/aspartoacylase family protein [Polyangiaceae bacterium]
MLGGETRWETPVYLLQSRQAGPTVLVLAGVHGDERAPPVAAWKLLELELTRGRLYIVPEVNRPALASGTRFSPRARFSDLNRNFPRKPGEPPRGFLAPVLWRAIQDIRPDWILDLHEGFDFNRRNKKSMGSSIVHVPGTSVSERALSAARTVQAAVNATIVSPSRHFTLIAPGPAGSVARSAQEVLGIPSLVFETTRIAQPIALRARQQELMVQAFLRQQSMLAESQPFNRFHRPRCGYAGSALGIARRYAGSASARAAAGLVRSIR